MIFGHPWCNESIASRVGPGLESSSKRAKTYDEFPLVQTACIDIINIDKCSNHNYLTLKYIVLLNPMAGLYHPHAYCFTILANAMI